MTDKERAATDGRLTSEALMKDRRRDVKTSMGKVLIRKLSLREVFTIGGSIVDLASMAGTEAEAEALVKRKDARSIKIMESLGNIVRAGVVEPKLRDDAADGATVDDIPFDVQLLLFGEIMAFAGFDKKAGEAIRPS